MTETENLKLSIFDPQDKPKWMVNWNGAMTNIDAFGGRTTANHTAVTASIKAGELRMDDLQDQIDTLEKNQTATGTDVAGLTNDVAFLQKTVDNYHHEIVTNTNNITANTEGVRDLYNTVNGLNLDVAKLNGDQSVTTASIAKMDVRLTKLEDEIGQVPEGVEERLNTVTASVSQMELKIAEQTLDIEANKNNITGFEMRMDAVEDNVTDLLSISRNLIIYIGDGGNDANDGMSESAPILTLERFKQIMALHPAENIDLFIVESLTFNESKRIYIDAQHCNLRGNLLEVNSGTVEISCNGKMNVYILTADIAAGAELVLGIGGGAVEYHPDSKVTGTGQLTFKYTILNFQPTTATTATLYIDHCVALWINRAQRPRVKANSAGNLLCGAKADYTQMTAGTNLYVATT